MHDVKEKVMKEIEKLTKEGISGSNLEALYKLVDIHKDISNEEYWKYLKGEMEMYDREEYGARGRGQSGRGRGRYNEGGYERSGRGNGSGTRYGNRSGRIYDIMDGWEEYRDGMDEYKDRGSYGAKEKGLESLEFMLDAFVKWFEDISRDAETQEEVDLIKKYAKKIKEM